MNDVVQNAFRALADPTRRDILHMLEHEKMTIGQVTSRFDMTRAAVKKHLTILEEGGLITVEARGRERVNHINPTGLAPVVSWLEYFDRFWDDQLSKLKSTIEKDIQ